MHLWGVLVALSPAAFVSSAATDRHDGNGFFEFTQEVATLFPGIGTNFGDNHDYPGKTSPSFGRRLSSSKELRRFHKIHDNAKRKDASTKKGLEGQKVKLKNEENLEQGHDLRNGYSQTVSPVQYERTAARKEENDQPSEGNFRYRTSFKHEERPSESPTYRFKTQFDRSPREREQNNMRQPVSSHTYSRQEGTTSRSEESKGSSTSRPRTKSYEIPIPMRRANSREYPTSDEKFIKNNDYDDLPVRKIFRKYKPTLSPDKQKNVNSYPGDAFLTDNNDFPNMKSQDHYTKDKSRSRPSSKNDRSYSQEQERFKQSDTSSNPSSDKNINKEEPLSRTSETFLTDEEDSFYFPEHQGKQFPAMPAIRGNKGNLHSFSDDAFLQDREEISNIFPNAAYKNHKPLPNHKDHNERNPSSETFLTDEESLLTDNPKNQYFSQSQGPQKNAPDKFLSEEEPLQPKKSTFRTLSKNDQTIRQNHNEENNFLTDNDRNSISVRQRNGNNLTPEHLGRVRWPPPKDLEDSREHKERQMPTMEPLFYEDTMGIKPPIIKHSSGEENVKQRKKTLNIKTIKTAPGGSKIKSEGVARAKQSDVSSNEDNSGQYSAEENVSSSENIRESQEESDEENSVEPNSPQQEESAEEFPGGESSVEEENQETPPQENRSQEDYLEELEEGSAEPNQGNGHDSSTELPKDSPDNDTHDLEDTTREETPDSEEVPPITNDDFDTPAPEENNESEEYLPELDDGPSESAEQGSASEEQSPYANVDSGERHPDHSSEESPSTENEDSERQSHESVTDSEEPLEHPPLSNESNDSNASNDDDSVNLPPLENSFSLEELFPNESDEHHKSTEDGLPPLPTFGKQPSKPVGNKRRPYLSGGNTSKKPSSDSVERPNKGSSSTENYYDYDSFKSSEENETPEYTGGSKRKPSYEDNSLNSNPDYDGKKSKPASRPQNIKGVEENFSPDFNLDSFEFEDFDAIEAPPSSGFGSPTTVRPGTTIRPTSLPADCTDSDDDEMTTPFPLDFLKAKRPKNTLKPERRPGDEVTTSRPLQQPIRVVDFPGQNLFPFKPVSITVASPKNVRTTKGTTTTTPRPVSIAALGVMKPGGEIIAKTVQPTSASTLPSTQQVEAPGKRATTPKAETWKAVLAAREATALTYLKPPPIGQPTTWMMSSNQPSSSFRLFVV